MTDFGKYLRKIRIDADEFMKDMALKLNVTDSYLSAVEVGKRNIPEDWIIKIATLYKLNKQQQLELMNAADNSKRQIKLDISKCNDTDKKLVLQFSKNFKTLSDNEKSQIMNILKRGG